MTRVIRYLAPLALAITLVGVAGVPLAGHAHAAAPHRGGCSTGQRTVSRTYYGDAHSYSTTLNVTFQYHYNCSLPNVTSVYCTTDYGIAHSITVNFCAVGGAHRAANATTVEEDATVQIAYGVGGFYNIWQTISSDASGNLRCTEDLPAYNYC